MSKKSIAIMIFATLLLTGCNTTNEIAVTSSSIISTTTDITTNTNTSVITTTTITTEAEPVEPELSEREIESSIDRASALLDELHAEWEKVEEEEYEATIEVETETVEGTAEVETEEKTIDMYPEDTAKQWILFCEDKMDECKEIANKYNSGECISIAYKIYSTCGLFAKIETTDSSEVAEMAAELHDEADKMYELAEELLHEKYIDWVDSVFVTVADDDPVNAGVSNEYGKVGNYTNTSYNEEWGRLGAADPVVKTTYFSDSQFDDLMKFVKSGYLPCSTNENMIKDPRIASRAGGIDNPRRPWWTEFDDASDMLSHTESDACWLIVTKDAKITKDVEKVLEDANASTEDYNAAVESLYGSDMCPGMEVMYSARNYCGDLIRIHVGGNEVNWSGKTWTAITENGLDESSVPGIDFKVECKEDPSAIRLLTAEESQTYAMSTGFGGGMAARFALTAPECGYEYDNDLDAAQQAPVSNHTSALDNAEYSTESFYTKDGDLISAGYIATKPGIFTCTVTNLANGDTVDIVIENLPVHYKELKWGCSTQREMDVVVGYHLNNPDNGLFAGDFQGVTNLYGVDGMGTTVSNFNSFNYPDINKEVVQLKNTAEAEEFCKYLFTYHPEWNKSKFGYNGYSAYGYLTRGQGECEAISANTQAILCLSGITTRYVGDSTHAWVEMLVPGSITTDGQDHWVSVDTGTLGYQDNVATWRSSNIIEGWDYWK